MIKRMLVAVLVFILVIGLGGALLWFGADPAGLGVQPLPLSLQGAKARAQVSPSILEVGDPKVDGRAWSLDITLDEALPEGGRVDVIFPAQVLSLGKGGEVYCSQLFFWTLFQTEDPNTRGYVGLDPVPGYPDLKVEVYHPLEMAWLAFNLFRGRDRGVLKEQVFTIKEAICHGSRAWVEAPEGGLAAGTTLTLRYGLPGGRGWAAPKSPVSVDLAVLIARGGGAPAKVVLPAPRLKFTGQEVASLRLVVPSTAEPGVPIPVRVWTLDGRGNINEAASGSVLISGLEGDVVEVPIHGGLGRAVGVPRGSGVQRIKGALRGSEGEVRGESNPMWVGEGARPIYWGDIHRHSVLADGWARPEEVWRRAKVLEGLDFAALSEHSHPDPLNFAGLYLRRILLTPREWAYLYRLTEEAQDAGTFATLQAYEWSGGTGHRNVYFGPQEAMDPILPFYPDSDLKRPPTPTDFLRAFEGRDAIVIPHHSAFKVIFGERFDWGEPAVAATVQTLVEIYSEHGSSEAPGGPRPLHGVPLMTPFWVATLFLGDTLLGPEDAAPPGQGNYVEEALAQGYPMGIMAASDAHHGPNAPISWPGGIMGIYGAELSREGVYGAMKERRVMGTTGARIALDISFGEEAAFGVGVGEARGGYLKINENIPFTLKVMGEGEIKEVEIRRHSKRGGYTSALLLRGAELEELAGGRGGWDGKAQGVLAPMTRGDFIYIRVVQEDGQAAWLGPFWAGELPEIRP